MFLSTLLINVGDNPDHPRPGRLWLRNLYRVHQRLCMAFPSRAVKGDDPLFLKPYRPCGFADPRPQRCTTTGSGDASAVCTVAGPNPPAVHVPRDGEHNFLFRVDPQPGGTVVIVVLSGPEPDWYYAFGLKPGVVDARGRPVGNAGYLLAARPDPPREMKLDMREGTPLRFRLVANVVRKATERSVDSQGRSLDPKWIGKHVPVPATEACLREWLDRRAEPGWCEFRHGSGQRRPGFRIVEMNNISAGYIYVNSGTKDASEGGRGQRLRTARYEGILAVTDADSFRQTLVGGIGPAKAFGCGLLSLAPVRA